jgi:hypothetical protein
VLAEAERRQAGLAHELEAARAAAAGLEQRLA